MSTDPSPIALVDPDERWALKVGASVLHYRRLSLGSLAALERQQTILAPPDRPGEPPRAVIPPAALEAAVVMAVLAGWEGVRGPDGGEIAYAPGLAGRLPAGVRRLLLARARQVMPADPPAGAGRPLSVNPRERKAQP